MLRGSSFTPQYVWMCVCVRVRVRRCITGQLLKESGGGERKRKAPTLHQINHVFIMEFYDNLI